MSLSASPAEEHRTDVRRTIDGTLQRSGLSPLPPRRHEAVPQGRALLHRQVRDREAQHPARPAWQVAQGEDRRLRHPAAREAEGQAHLRRAREPVPPLLRVGGPPPRRHRRDAAAVARDAPRQRRLPPRLRHLAPAGAAAGAARALPDQRQEGRHPVLRGQDGRRGAGARASAKNAAIAHAIDEVKGRGVPEWLQVDAASTLGRVSRSRRANRSTCRCRNSSSSSSTRSNVVGSDVRPARGARRRTPARSFQTCGGRRWPLHAWRPRQASGKDQTCCGKVSSGRSGSSSSVRRSPTVRPFLRAAVRARFRHDHRQYAAPRAALVDRGRGRHRRQDRRRAARVLADSGRGRGRHRRHPQPEADPDRDAHRRGEDALRARRRPGAVRARDIEVDQDVEILEPDAHIATVAERASCTWSCA